MKNSPIPLFDENMSSIIYSLKNFFFKENFLEVTTPIVIEYPLPEPHINAIPAKEGGFYRTSPELNMKIILAHNKSDIFEIGSSFRKDEIGRIHKEQFTMVEWYKVNANYLDLIGFTKEMLIFISNKINNSSTIQFEDVWIDLDSDWEIFTLNELFAKFANCTPLDALQKGEYEELLSFKIEPNLPKDKPVIIKDFPAELAALSKLSSDNSSIAERWELYLGGIEIANTYTELTDEKEHIKRFAEFAIEREKIGAPKYPVEPRFLDALKIGIPHSSGCALGVDRLNMIFNNMNSI